MRTINLNYPSKLSMGAGCLRELSGDISGMKVSRIFILSIQEIGPVLEPYYSELRESGLTLEIDLSIRSEPTITDFRRILYTAKAFKPELVLGIGGGSVLDVAKLIAAQINNSQSLEEIMGINLLKGRSTKLVCVPTTSGTGSEVSPNAILLDEKDQLKKGIISSFLVPDSCYIDPELTLSVPPSVTAATGVDAFTHCMEAYINKRSHPVIDTYALEGMKLIAGNIWNAVNNGSDIQARTDLSLGSMYGGMCLGPVNTTAIHALSYPLGSEFHIAHGLSNALLMPYVMEFNLPVAAERYANVARILGVEDRKDPKEMAEAGIVAAKKLLSDCGIPATISEIGIPEEAIQRMAASAMNVQRLLVNNPREVLLDDAIAIYSNAYKN